MTHDEILKGLYDQTLTGNGPAVLELTHAGLAAGVTPESLLFNALTKAGLRDDVIIMVGGAPVTQEYADAVGADGYAADASAAVKRAKDLLAQRRALTTV